MSPYRENATPAPEREPLLARFRKSAALLALAAFVHVAGSACALTPGEKKAINTALDVMQYGCVIAHALSDDATIAQVCGIADVLIPDMRKVLETFRAEREKAVALRMAAMHCDATMMPEPSWDAGAKPDAMPPKDAGPPKDAAHKD